MKMLTRAEAERRVAYSLTADYAGRDLGDLVNRKKWPGLVDTWEEFGVALRQLSAPAVRTLAWAIEQALRRAAQDASVQAQTALGRRLSREALAQLVGVAEKCYQQGKRHGRAAKAKR